MSATTATAYVSPVAPVEAATSPSHAGRDRADSGFGAALARAADAKPSAHDRTLEHRASDVEDAPVDPVADEIVAIDARHPPGPSEDDRDGLDVADAEPSRELSVEELELGPEIVDTTPDPGDAGETGETGSDDGPDAEPAVDRVELDAASAPLDPALATGLDTAALGLAATTQSPDPARDPGLTAPFSSRGTTGIAAYRRGSAAVPEPLQPSTGVALALGPIASERVVIEPATSPAAPEPSAASNPGSQSHAREPVASTGVTSPGPVAPAESGTAATTMPSASELASALAPEPGTGVDPSIARTDPSPIVDGPLPSGARTAAPADPIAAPVSHAAVILERIEDLAIAIERMRPIPRGGAVLEVQTPGFGPMRVEVTLDDGAVRIRIDSDDPRAAAWIEGEQRGLVAAARQAAPDARSVELDLRQGHGDGRERSSDRARAAEREALRVPGTPATAPAAQPAAIATARRGLVDVLA